MQALTAGVCQEIEETQTPSSEIGNSGGERARRHLRPRTMEECIRTTRTGPGIYSAGNTVCECGNARSYRESVGQAANDFSKEGGMGRTGYGHWRTHNSQGANEENSHRQQGTFTRGGLNGGQHNDRYPSTRHSQDDFSLSESEFKREQAHRSHARTGVKDNRQNYGDQFSHSENWDESTKDFKNRKDGDESIKYDDDRIHWNTRSDFGSGITQNTNDRSSSVFHTDGGSRRNDEAHIDTGYRKMSTDQVRTNFQVNGKGKTYFGQEISNKDDFGSQDENYRRESEGAVMNGGKLGGGAHGGRNIEIGNGRSQINNDENGYSLNSGRNNKYPPNNNFSTGRASFKTSNARRFQTKEDGGNKNEDSVKLPDMQNWNTREHDFVGQNEANSRIGGRSYGRIDRTMGINGMTGRSDNGFSGTSEGSNVFGSISGSKESSAGGGFDLSGRMPNVPGSVSSSSAMLGESRNTFGGTGEERRIGGGARISGSERRSTFSGNRGVLAGSEGIKNVGGVGIETDKFEATGSFGRGSSVVGEAGNVRGGSGGGRRVLGGFGTGDSTHSTASRSETGIANRVTGKVNNKAIGFEVGATLPKSGGGFGEESYMYGEAGGALSGTKRISKVGGVGIGTASPGIGGGFGGGSRISDEIGGSLGGSGGVRKTGDVEIGPTLPGVGGGFGGESRMFGEIGGALGESEGMSKVGGVGVESAIPEVGGGIGAGSSAFGGVVGVPDISEGISKVGSRGFDVNLPGVDEGFGGGISTLGEVGSALGGSEGTSNLGSVGVAALPGVVGHFGGESSMFGGSGEGLSTLGTGDIKRGMVDESSKGSSIFGGATEQSGGVMSGIEVIVPGAGGADISETAKGVLHHVGLASSSTGIGSNVGIKTIPGPINPGNFNLSTGSVIGLMDTGVPIKEKEETPNPKKEIEVVNTKAAEAETSTDSTDDYDEDEDDCDGGFELFNKIICIFKIIYGLLFGSPDPCCPIEIPSFG